MVGFNGASVLVEALLPGIVVSVASPIFLTQKAGKTAYIAGLRCQLPKTVGERHALPGSGNNSEPNRYTTEVSDKLNRCLT